MQVSGDMAAVWPRYLTVGQSLRSPVSGTVYIDPKSRGRKGPREGREEGRKEGRKERALHGDKINGTAVSRVQYSVFPILRKHSMTF